MVKVLEVKLLSMAQAANSLSNRPAVSTLWRWSSRGVKGVRLKTLVVGGRRYTTPEFLSEFSARLSDRRTANEPGDSQRDAHDKSLADVRAKALFD